MRRVVSQCSVTAGVVARRWILLEVSTKGLTTMRHLDVYARRDPQLAPYLLREVDTEWKRRCMKVKFMFWLGLFVFLFCLDERVQMETFHYMKLYAEQHKMEQEARDDDCNIRRAKLVEATKVIRNAFHRKTWTSKDHKLIMDILK